MRRTFSLCLALLIALSGVAGVTPALACTSSGVPAVVTDRSDYFAGSTVAIKASGLACAAPYTIIVTAPNGATQGFSVVADADGAAHASLLFSGDPGDHEVSVSNATGAVVARTHFHGSHFRYGHLTWRPVGTRQAEFTLINAFRRSGYGAPVVGSVFTENVGGTALCFGDGSCTNTLQYETLAFDAAQDWVIGRAIQPAGVVTLPGTGVTVSESEPNDSIAQADSANVGDDFAGNTSGCGPTDYVGFTLSGPTTISLRIRHAGLGDSLLWLYDAAGNELAFNDDTFGLESFIQQPLPAGTFYAAVGGFGCSAGGYRLEIRGSATAPAGVITHTYSGNGPFTAQISSCCRIGSLQNGSNGNYVVSTLVRFDQVNSSPVSALPPIVNAPVNTAGFSFLVPAVDADGDALSFRLATSAESGATSIPGLTVNATTGLVSWSTVGRTVGQLWTQQIVIEERRAGVLIGQVAVDFIIRIVSAIGNAPTCAFTPNQTTYNIQAGSALSFTVTGSDVDAGDTLQLNTAGVPSGATMTPGLPRSGASPLSSTFDWTPPQNQNNASFVVAFTVSDANGQAAQCSVTINVTSQPTNRRPTANAGGPYTVLEGGSVVLTGSGNDPDAGQTLTYAWDLDNDGTFETAGLPATFSAATIDGPATRTVVLRVCDSATPSLCATSNGQVTIANADPTVTLSNNGPIDEGSPATVTATASDPAGAADPLSYSFDCDNDGSYETGPQSANSSTCSYPDNGSFVVNVRVTDGDGGSATARTTVVVNNVSPVVTAPGGTIDEGQTFNGSGSFTDPGADTWSATIDDGTGPVTLALSGKTFSWSRSYDDNGTFSATITVTDDDGGTGSATATVTVRNVAPTASASNDGPNYWGMAIGFTGTATDPSAADTTAGFTGAWAFGDSATAGGMTASHAYATPGAHTASFTATDKDGGISAAATTLVTVNKRPTTLSCADASGVFGFATTLASQLRDGVSNTVLTGETIAWTVNGVTLSGNTTPSGLMPGTHAVGASFAGNALYTGSTATCTLTVGNSVGKITTGLIRFEGKGRGGFNVQNDATTLGPKGELQFQNTATDLHVHTMTAIGISADRTKGWFAGTGTNGQNVVVYVEDNGEPGTNDVVKVWIDGVSQNGDGDLSGGNVQIH